MCVFGDMNENVPHRLMGLPTGGDVCEDFGCVALLDKVCYWGRTSSLKPHTIPVCSLLPDCAEEVTSQLRASSSRHHVCHLLPCCSSHSGQEPSGTLTQMNSSFSKLSWSPVFITAIKQ